jgi:hypothetical protein
MRIDVVRAWLLAAVLASGGCGQSAVSDDNEQAKTLVSPAEAEGDWEELPRAPVGWYRPEGAFLIDDRLVVVAGSTIEAWSPQNDEWKVLVTVAQAGECEGCGYSETVMWTGKEFILWGGGFSIEHQTAARMRDQPSI